MLYAFLRLVIQITIGVYFKEVVVRNSDKIPKDAPLIIVPNHPSSYMDALVVGSLVKRKLFFLTRGESFDTRFSRWLLNLLHMIPIYRRDKTPEMMNKNEEVFQRCFQLLAKHGSFLIFPEGLSKTEPRLRKLKTGAARIALGAEAENSFKLGVKILPIGLNYTDPHKFRSELFINIAQPIEVSDFKKVYLDDTMKGARALTEHIRDRLEEHTILIENEENDELVSQIEKIYKAKLLKEEGIETQDKDRSFLLSKDIVEAVSYFQQNDPKFISKVRRKINKYLKDLGKLNLKDEILSGNTGKQGLILSSVLPLLYLIVGFPFYLYGLINNYVPFKVPDIIVKLLSARPDFIGSVYMTSGILTFLIFYSLQVFTISSIFHSTLITFLYALSLPLSGFFTFRYWKYMLAIKDRLAFITMFYTKSGLIKDLIKKRDELIKLLEEAKERIQNDPEMTGTD